MSGTLHTQLTLLSNIFSRAISNNRLAFILKEAAEAPKATPNFCSINSNTLGTTPAHYCAGESGQKIISAVTSANFTTTPPGNCHGFFAGTGSMNDKIIQALTRVFGCSSIRDVPVAKEIEGLSLFSKCSYGSAYSHWYLISKRFSESVGRFSTAYVADKDAKSNSGWVVAEKPVLTANKINIVYVDGYSSYLDMLLMPCLKSAGTSFAYSSLSTFINLLPISSLYKQAFNFSLAYLACGLPGVCLQVSQLALSKLFSQSAATSFGLGVSIVLAGMALTNPATNAVLLGAQIISSMALAIPGQLVGQKAAVTLLKKRSANASHDVKILESSLYAPAKDFGIICF